MKSISERDTKNLVEILPHVIGKIEEPRTATWLVKLKRAVSIAGEEITASDAALDRKHAKKGEDGQPKKTMVNFTQFVDGKAEQVPIEQTVHTDEDKYQEELFKKRSSLIKLDIDGLSFNKLQDAIKAFGEGSQAFVLELHEIGLLTIKDLK